jgi:DNA mismatch repair protein MutL
MPKIKLLDEDLINKIAAGEVIERPASVVKELIENSLDAQATKILIEIKNSGKDLIKISDNGHGMDEEDAKNSILRHATSKITSVEDLFSVNTLGFRGEALASIAAVSQLSIITKQDQLEGFNLVVEGSLIISEGVIGANKGTTIEVRNLFYNTPARKKFMKTDSVELRHIIDVVTHYALLNKNVSFILKHDGHILLNSPAIEDMQGNIAQIYGLGLAKDLLEVNHQDDSIKVKGCIAKPHRARNDKNQQAIFVNGRWVKNSDIAKAVYEGFHSLLFVNKHPIFVLELELNPEKVDVNVHPQKLEIKIEQIEQVCKVIAEAVKDTLQKNNLIPIMDVEPEFDFSKLKKPTYSFEKSKQTVLKEEDIPKVISQPTAMEQEISKEIKETPKFPAMKLLGQINKTYFLAETEGGVFFIDQHAAHERVMYDKFMEEYMDKSVVIQTLLKGEMIDLTPSEKVTFEENKDAILDVGFLVEHFEGNTYVIKTIPSIFNRLLPKELLHELLDSLKGEKLEEIKEVIVTRMACRSAVMAGDILTIPQFERILSELALCDLPYTCPHGRPSMFLTTAEELEKKFRRKG